MQSMPAVASRLSCCLAKSMSLMGMECALVMVALCCMALRSCNCMAHTIPSACCVPGLAPLQSL